MIVEYTRYKIDEQRSSTFEKAYKNYRATMQPDVRACYVTNEAG